MWEERSSKVTSPLRSTPQRSQARSSRTSRSVSTFQDQRATPAALIARRRFVVPHTSRSAPSLKTDLVPSIGALPLSPPAHGQVRVGACTPLKVARDLLRVTGRSEVD